MNQSKRITDGALLIAVYIVLLLIMLFVPFLFTFGIFMLPVPFIIYASKHGLRPALVMLLSAILLSLAFAAVISLPITLLTGIGGILIGAAIYRNLRAYETWARGALGFIIGIVLVLFLLQFVANINIYQEIDALTEDAISATRSVMGQFGMDADAEAQIELIEQQLLMFKDLLPSSIALLGILLAFVSQWLSYKVLNRIENMDLRFPPFKQFNLPVSLIWVYFFSLILSFVDLGEDSGLYLVVVNTVALTIALITIQGYSFIFFYADHKKMHKSIPIIITAATLLVPFLFMFIIRIIGIIDLGFSLKKRLAEGNNP